MENENEKFVDIEKVIRKKNPKLLKRLPGFIISFLKRILHEDENNEVIGANQGQDGFVFSKYVLNNFKITVNAFGLDNVPKEGGVILASNHPLGGMDALALIQVMEPHRKDIKFVVNDILLALKNLKGLFVGVNKHGKTSSEVLQEMNDIFSSGVATFVFPAGLVSRRLGKTISDLEWKKTFVTRSKKFDTPVIPVFVDGSLSKRFYRLAKIRTLFGIKTNIEMLYLVDEQYRQKNKVINIYFGKPIPSSTFDKSKNDKSWAMWVKDIVYKLKKASN
ncbi:MAG: putative hemolysin [Saprospiraceae bacterium]|jgi:putative hemolysin